jgi:hypothetical protein
VLRTTQGHADRSLTTTVEVSPDALYMRSTLRINGSEYTDFGTYICKVTNSLGTDQMHILLQSTAPSGKCSRSAHIARGTVVVVVSFCSPPVGRLYATAGGRQRVPARTGTL